MDWQQMFFDGWGGIVRVLVVGTLAYAFLIVSLRVSGKRTLAKLNAFDLVVTVAFGSSLASILLSQDVPLAEGATALVLLIVLQFAVAWSSVRSRRFARLVRSEPTLLVRDGTLCREAMARARVTEAELETVVRTEGQRGLGDIAMVVLESDGSFSVIADAEDARRAEPQASRIG